MTYPKLIFRVHAVQRMAQRHISENDVRLVLTAGEIIEDYASDTPYPSRLLLGWTGQRPLHVVAADNDANQETIVITAYEPDPNQWTADFRRRRT